MLNIIAGAFLIAALAAAGGQTAPAETAPATPPTKQANSKPVVLSGCVVRPDADRITLKDPKNGTFELNGHGLDIYIGKRVEASGTSSGGLHITTGLYPSANAAAQAGADPVQTFTATLPGGTTHETAPEPLPAFAVAHIRTVKGDCK